MVRPDIVREKLCAFVSSVMLAAAATFGLAACNRGPSVDLKNATPAEVAKAMKDSGADRLLVRPGNWSSTVTIVALDTAQLPPEVAAAINAQIGKPRTVEACLTEDQVAHPERLLARVPAGCRYETYKMSAGRSTAIWSARARARAPTRTP